MSCNHNCRQGRDCPARATYTTPWRRHLAHLARWLIQAFIGILLMVLLLKAIYA